MSSASCIKLVMIDGSMEGDLGVDAYYLNSEKLGPPHRYTSFLLHLGIEQRSNPFGAFHLQQDLLHSATNFVGASASGAARSYSLRMTGCWLAPSLK